MTCHKHAPQPVYRYMASSHRTIPSINMMHEVSYIKMLGVEFLPSMQYNFHRLVSEWRCVLWTVALTGMHSDYISTPA